MKTLLLLLLLPFCVAAQSNKIASPMGNIVSISPGTTITQTSPVTTFYTETIPAGTFIPNRWYHMYMAFKLTTPTLGIPGLSVTFQYGSQTFNLMSNASLLGSITNGLFTIDFYMLSTGISSQIPFAEIRQPNGSVISLSPSTATPVGAFTTNAAVDNVFSVSIQFTGASLGTSSLNNFWVFRDAF
jgi:hypothetical protein